MSNVPRISSIDGQRWRSWTHLVQAKMNMASAEAKEQAIQAVRSWVGSLPAGVVSVCEERAPYEIAIKVQPVKQGPASVELRIGDYGTFGLYLSAIRIEDLPLSEQLVLEILEAVKSGHVDEEIWERNGKVQRRHTILRMPSRELHGREDVTIAGTFGIGLGDRSVRSFAPLV